MPKGIKRGALLPKLLAAALWTVGCTQTAPPSVASPERAINVIEKPNDTPSPSSPERDRFLRLYRELAGALEPVVNLDLYIPVCGIMGAAASMDAILERESEVGSLLDCLGSVKVFLPYLVARLKAANDFEFANETEKGAPGVTKRVEGSKVTYNRGWALAATSDVEAAQVIVHEYFHKAPDRRLPAGFPEEPAEVLEKYADRIAATIVSLAVLNDFGSRAELTRVLVFDGALRAKLAITGKSAPLHVSAGHFVGDRTPEIFLSNGELGVALHSSITGQAISEYAEPSSFTESTLFLDVSTPLAFFGNTREGTGVSVIAPNGSSHWKFDWPVRGFFRHRAGNASESNPELNLGVLLESGSIRLANPTSKRWCSASGDTLTPVSSTADRTDFKKAMSVRYGPFQDENMQVIFGYDGARTMMYSRCAGQTGHVKRALTTELELMAEPFLLLPPTRPNLPSLSRPIAVGYRARDQSLVTIGKDLEDRKLPISVETPNAIAVVRAPDLDEATGLVVALEKGTLSAYDPTSGSIVYRIPISRRFNEMFTRDLTDPNVHNRLIVYEKAVAP